MRFGRFAPQKKLQLKFAAFFVLIQYVKYDSESGDSLHRKIRNLHPLKTPCLSSATSRPLFGIRPHVSRRN